jgi:lysophospholipase L1-like esterase
MRLRLALRTIVTGLLVVLLVAPAVPSQAQAAPPLPTTVAALGDSITRGYNACGWYVSCSSRSWSTGGSSTVGSHYLRLQSLGAAPTRYNDAATGATVADLDRQAGRAVAQGADYVTVLIGANDACAGTESGMTATARFDARLRTGLDRLRAGLPDARVLVASVPDVKRLWRIGKDSWRARAAWSAFGICQSMLDRPRSTSQADVDRRDRVRQRVAAYNRLLAAACADYGDRCRYDGGAVYRYRFTLDQVSRWDYFHPNTAGQAALADVTWSAGYW